MFFHTPSAMSKRIVQHYTKIINNYKYHILSGLFFLLMFILLLDKIASIFAVFILILAGSFGQIYKRYIRLTSAVEFVTFGTVLIAMAYGPIPAILFAIAVSFAAEVISGNLDGFMFFYIPVRALSGILAAFIPGSPIFVGIITTIFINGLAQPIYLLNPDSEMKIRGLIYLVINISFNFILFTLLGKFMLSLL